MPSRPKSPLRRKKTRRFHVEDWSMAPELVPGDVVFVELREGPWMEPPHENDIVVIEDPEVPGRKLVKRVKSIVDREGTVLLEVTGDNVLRSRDSRHFGPVPIGSLVGIATRK